MAIMPHQSSASDTGPRGGRGAWYATALLTLCFTLSYIDRQILSLLVTPIKASLKLSDSEIGVLQGVSFSIFYVAATLPLARLADRSHRPLIMTWCIAAWSLMTMLCGTAASFWQLMLARIGVAVGEAGLPPSALTLMADVHTPKGLARATSIFLLAPFVGGGIALMGGGLLYEMSASWTMPTLPLLGTLERWQLMFLLVGAPGLLLAPLVVLTLREPRMSATVAKQEGSVAALFKFLLGNWRFCIVYIVAVSFTVTLFNAHIAWMPTAILRSHAIGEGAMGTAFGIIYLGAGSAGTLAAGWIVARAGGQNMVARTIRMMRMNAAVLILPAVFAPLAPTLMLSYGLLTISVFCTSAVVSVSSLPFQFVAPKAIRAQAIAMTGLVAALLGTGLGPLLVGILSDLYAGLSLGQPLSAALATVAALLMPVVTLMMGYALKNLGRVMPGTQAAV